MHVSEHDYRLSRRDQARRLRLYVLFCVVVAIAVFEILRVPNRYSILAVVIGTGLTALSFFEPVLNPLLEKVFKRARIISRRDIYDAIIDQLATADRLVRFKTPTTTWGQYSEGLKIFEATLDAIEHAVARGVEVHIIADLWDWERAKFTIALLRYGATVRYAKTTFDYYIITDAAQLITMGTEDRAHYIKSIDRQVKRLKESAVVSSDPEVVELAIRRFDEEWNSLSESSMLARIAELLSCSCPACGASGHVAFRDQRVLFETGDVTLD